MLASPVPSLVVESTGLPDPDGVGVGLGDTDGDVDAFGLLAADELGDGVADVELAAGLVDDGAGVTVRFDDGREERGDTALWFPANGMSPQVQAGNRTVGDSLNFSPPFAGTIFVFEDQRAFDTAPLLKAIQAGHDPEFGGSVRRVQVPGGR